MLSKDAPWTLTSSRCSLKLRRRRRRRGDGSVSNSACCTNVMTCVWSLAPPHFLKKKVRCGSECLSSQHWGNGDRRILRTCWPASWAEPMSSRLCQSQGQSNWGSPRHRSLASTYLHMCVHPQMHIYTEWRFPEEAYKHWPSSLAKHFRMRHEI